MDEFYHHAMSGIELLELELIVRDFVTVLNDGAMSDVVAFLTEDVVYRSSAHQTIAGRPAVVSMVQDLRSAFDEWRTSLLTVAVANDVVLAEQAVCLKLAHTERQWVMGFSSFRLDGMRICAWHQVHG